MGATNRRALDGGQRARRPRRRDPSRLSDLGPGWGFLRLALLLLGADGGRSGTAGSGRGRKGHHAGLRAGRAHRVAGSMLAAGRHASGLSRRYGHRAARLLEPQHAEWLQGRLRAVRERAPGRAAAGYSDRIPRTGRAGVLWTTGRSNTRSGRLRSSGGRCWRCDLARNERAAWLTDRDSLCRRSKCPLAEPISAKASGTYRPCPFGAKGRRALFPKLRYGHHLRRNRTGPLLMLRENRTAQVWIQPMVGIRLRYLQKN